MDCMIISIRALYSGYLVVIYFCFCRKKNQIKYNLRTKLSLYFIFYFSSDFRYPRQWSCLLVLNVVFYYCSYYIFFFSVINFFSNIGFFYKKKVDKKMSLKNSKTLRKCWENLQPQVLELQFLKTLIFLRAL